VTLFYPDIYHGDSKRYTGDKPQVLCAKATEGIDFADPEYSRNRTWADMNGVYFIAYHWLHVGNELEQALWCYMHVGPRVPLMLDVEISRNDTPGLPSIKLFVNEYRRLGGIVSLVYLPHWYWNGSLKAPDLTWLTRNGLGLVSSNYKPYSDDGPGWEPYGGVTPIVWQYTDNQGGIDYNAFKGTLSEFKRITSGWDTDMFDDTDKEHLRQVWQVNSDAYVDSKTEVGSDEALSIGHQVYQMYVMMQQMTAEVAGIKSILGSLQSGGATADEIVDQLALRLEPPPRP